VGTLQCVSSACCVARRKAIQRILLASVVMSQPVDSGFQSFPSRLMRLSRSSSQKLSVDDFYVLCRQQLLGTDASVELVKGEVCQLPTDEQLNRQIELMKSQIQHHLPFVRGCDGIVVRSRQPLRLNEYSELKPALSFFKDSDVRSGDVRSGHSCPLWVVDVTQEGLNWLNTGRSQLLAAAGIAEYWSLTVSQAELRTYQNPTNAGYQSCQLLHVGESVAPRAIQQLTLKLQEPVPLHFLTRTLGGQRSYETLTLPLHVCLADG